MPGPLGKGRPAFLLTSATGPQASKAPSPPGVKDAHPPGTPNQENSPARSQKPWAPSKPWQCLRSPPGPRGHLGLAAGKDLGDQRGQEEQGCSWSPGLWREQAYRGAAHLRTQAGVTAQPGDVIPFSRSFWTFFQVLSWPQGRSKQSPSSRPGGPAGEEGSPPSHPSLAGTQKPAGHWGPAWGA